MMAGLCSLQVSCSPSYLLYVNVSHERMVYFFGLLLSLDFEIHLCSTNLSLSPCSIITLPGYTKHCLFPIGNIVTSWERTQPGGWLVPYWVGTSLKTLPAHTQTFVHLLLHLLTSSWHSSLWYTSLPSCVTRVSPVMFGMSSCAFLSFVLSGDVSIQTLCAFQKISYY